MAKVLVFWLRSSTVPISGLSVNRHMPLRRATVPQQNNLSMIQSHYVWDVNTLITRTWTSWGVYGCLYTPWI